MFGQSFFSFFVSPWFTYTETSYRCVHIVHRRRKTSLKQNKTASSTLSAASCEVVAITSFPSFSRSCICKLVIGGEKKNVSPSSDFSAVAARVQPHNVTVAVSQMHHPRFKILDAFAFPVFELRYCSRRWTVHSFKSEMGLFALCGTAFDYFYVARGVFCAQLGCQHYYVFAFFSFCKATSCFAHVSNTMMRSICLCYAYWTLLFGVANLGLVHLLLVLHRILWGLV